ncbi:unnamed protein product [Ilex paraguariensis]|uniref:F-box domain-containing protein n=1 Tax=Ilex paraguariensis TaxID=185542 RepID=A0ABC8SJJ5_9AQUA
MASSCRRPSDMISNLPGNVIETILMRLPIRDAVRTSILSRKWRYIWAKLPEIVFDDTLCQESVENQHGAKTKLAETIYQVLLLHHGPILKFTLSIPGLESSYEIDQLILFLLRNGIEDFTLQMRESEPYKLPAAFFSCIQMKYLDLHFCVFKPSPSFKGFSRLTSLKFCEVNVGREIIESLISNCPLLEQFTLKLTLEISDSINYLEINAPNLKFFFFQGILKSIWFKNAPLLAEVEIYTENPVDNSLAVGGVPNKLSSTLINLKILTLYEICFEQLDEVSCTLCLMRSSPTLQKITIEACPDICGGIGVSEFLGRQHHSDIVLEKLQKVNMQVVSDTRAQLEFIKLLLAKSPVLETMLLEPKSMKADEGLNLLKVITQFRRASADAEVLFKDW